MKNFNELRLFLASLLTAGKNILADGKLTGSDLPAIFRPAMLASEAIDDIELAFKESAAASNEEMDQSKAIFANELQGFDPDDAYDIKAIEAGGVSIGRMIARARLKGIEEGAENERTRITQTLKAHNVDTNKIEGL